jgi:hypothetical protein
MLVRPGRRADRQCCCGPAARGVPTPGPAARRDGCPSRGRSCRLDRTAETGRRPGTRPTTRGSTMTAAGPTAYPTNWRPAGAPPPDTRHPTELRGDRAGRRRLHRGADTRGVRRPGGPHPQRRTVAESVRTLMLSTNASLADAQHPVAAVSAARGSERTPNRHSASDRLRVTGPVQLAI